MGFRGLNVLEKFAKTLGTLKGNKKGHNKSLLDISNTLLVLIFKSVHIFADSN